MPQLYEQPRARLDFFRNYFFEFSHANKGERAEIRDGKRASTVYINI